LRGPRVLVRPYPTACHFSRDVRRALRRTGGPHPRRAAPYAAALQALLPPGRCLLRRPAGGPSRRPATTARNSTANIVEIRCLAREAKYNRCRGELVGPSSDTSGLVGLPGRSGFCPPRPPPLSRPSRTGCCCERSTRSPGRVEGAVVSRRDDDYAMAIRIANGRPFGESEEPRARRIGSRPRPRCGSTEGGSRVASRPGVPFDERPVGFGLRVMWPPAALGGSGVSRRRRGRGAIPRADSAARWALSFHLGSPALAIRAGAMGGGVSRPISRAVAASRPICPPRDDGHLTI